jgi:hypothetical protein
MILLKFNHIFKFIIQLKFKKKERFITSRFIDEIYAHT